MNPDPQKHAFSWQYPRPLQSSSHASSAQASPVKLAEHAQVPLAQTPLPLQMAPLALDGQPEAAQSLPAKPGRHLQLPLTQSPCPEHSLMHTFSPQERPVQPSLQKHSPWGLQVPRRLQSSAQPLMEQSIPV
jgi:hypothetical protein